MKIKFLNINYYLTYIIVLFLCLTPLKAEKITKILVTINNSDIISSYDFEQFKYINKYLNPTKQTEKEILDNEINNILLNQEAKKFGINNIEQEQIKQYLDNIEKKGVSIVSLKNDKNINEEFLTNYIKNSIIRETLIQYLISSNVTVTEEEINIETNRIASLNGVPAFLLAEIFIKNNENKDQTLNKVNKIYNKAIQNNNFGNTALKYSESISAKNKGDIGWVLAMQLTNNQLENIHKVGKNKITQPIKVQNGYIIFLVKNQKTEVSFNPNDPSINSLLRQTARQNIFMQKAELFIKDHIEQLRNKASIEIKQ